MKKRTILLSVKNPADYNLLADLLQKEGYRVEKLTGANKMELAKKADAVLVDEVTGLKVCSFLKEIKESAKPFLPLLALLPEKAPAEPWLNKGFDDVIRMPVGKAEFRSRINSFLKLRAQSEQIIESSEQKYKAVFEATGTATVIVDEDTTIVLANNECEKITGYSPAKLIGKSWTEFVYKEDLPLMLSRLKAHRENPKSVERKYEVRLINAKGEIRNIILSIAMIPGTKQSVISLLDITERKQAEMALKKSEEKFRTLIENSLDMIQIVNKKGILTYVSPSVQRILGYKPEELIGKPSAAIVHPEDLPVVTKGFEKILKNPEKPLSTICRYKHKDGTWRILKGISTNQLNNPSINGFLSNTRDITEHKRAEEELKNSEERLKIMFEYAPDAYYLSDLKGYFIDGNKAAENLVGYKKEEVIGKSFLNLDLLSAKELLKASKLLAKNLQGKGTGPDEFTLNRKDGSQVSVEIRTYPVKIKGKTVVLGIARDITERKKVEMALKESEAKFRLLFSEMTEGVYLHEVIYNKRGKAINYRIIEANPASEKHLNIKPKYAIGKLATELYRTKEAPFLDIFAKVAETGKSVTFEEYFPPMKKYFHISVYCPEKGKFATVFTDITQRKRAEELLKQNEYLLRQVLNTNPAVIFVKDKDSRILLANKVMAAFYNLSVEDVIGQRQSDLHRRFGADPKQIQKWLASDKEVIETGQPKHMIEPGTDSQGRQIWFRTGKYPINIGKGRRGVLVISENITEQKKAEEQIQKELQEKELLLRELYHRTKNNMQVISAMLRLRARTMPDETVRASFRDIEMKIRSMALVHQKLYESQDLSSLNLKSYFNDLISGLRQSFLSEADKIQFHFDAPEDIHVSIDAAIPLGLILNELLTNAVNHAFPAEKKGKICVVLKKDAQKRLIIEVSDNGAGFPEGFDVEKDSHLGLQTVIELVRHQLEGKITFTNKKGLKCRIVIEKELYTPRV